MRESQIEQKLVQAVKARGGIALKFTSPSFDGMPDRLLLFPKGRVAWVEVKATGKKLRPLQVKRKRQLEQLGFRCFVLDSVEQIGEILDEILPP
ncbi:MAG: VRR-NUC domain-containing protein [Eubacteriales bacterium]